MESGQVGWLSWGGGAHRGLEQEKSRLLWASWAVKQRSLRKGTELDEKTPKSCAFSGGQRFLDNQVPQCGQNHYEKTTWILALPSIFIGSIFLAASQASFMQGLILWQALS